MEISAQDVAKLRKMSGAGLMDCKKALAEANGDFDTAIDLLRKKGQKIAGNRADRDANEGCVLAGLTADKKRAAIVALNCETDFVAKNEDFIKLTNNILQTALTQKPANLEALLALKLGAHSIADEVINQTGVIGEKIELSYYEFVEAESVINYIHPGNKLASIAGFNVAGIDEQVEKDIVMQIAAMAPVSLDKDDVPQSVIDKELEIGKAQAIEEGKPADMAEKIAVGRLNKFYKESTLLNQAFIKDNKKSISEYLKETNKNLTVTSFKRFNIGA